MLTRLNGCSCQHPSQLFQARCIGGLFSGGQSAVQVDIGTIMLSKQLAFLCSHGRFPGRSIDAWNGVINTQEVQQWCQIVLERSLVNKVVRETIAALVHEPIRQRSKVIEPHHPLHQCRVQQQVFHGVDGLQHVMHGGHFHNQILTGVCFAPFLVVVKRTRKPLVRVPNDANDKVQVVRGL